MPSQPCAPTEDRPAQGLAAFVRGALDVWRGFAFLLGRPALWIWAVIPFAINLAIFGLCAWLSWPPSGQLLARPINVASGVSSVQ